MNKFKKILAVLAIFSFLFVGAPVRSVVLAASDADASVGEDGNAVSTTEDNDVLTITNGNNEGGDSIDNTDLWTGTTGGNVQDANDDTNKMRTGSANGGAMSDNFLHSNVVTVEDEALEGSAHAGATVGEDGNATASAFDNDEFTIDNNNEGSIVNTTVALGTTGGNSQSGNDDGNILWTGSATAMAQALNELNNNWVTLGSSNSAHANASVGEDGDASSTAEDDDIVNLTNNNIVNEFTNTATASSTTGGNIQTGNDDDNSVSSGAATASTKSNNFVNNNVTKVGNTGGSSNATSHVGDDGNANSSSSDNDEVNVTNNNEATVTNTSTSAATSGGNVQSGNDDGNSMETGNTSGTTCSSNTANSNWTSVGAGAPGSSTGSCN